MTDFVSTITTLGQHAQAGRVMAFAAVVELDLERLLEAHMPALSKNLRAKLFEAYGPISTFSAKIDLCYAFGFITQDQHKTLTSIKAIRNKFAHAHTLIHFDHESVVNLPQASPLNTSEEKYIEACSSIDRAIDQILEQMQAST